MTVQIRIPVPDSELAVNLAGLSGLVVVVIGVGGLSGNWWVSLILAGLVSVWLSVMAGQRLAVADQAAGPRAVPAAGSNAQVLADVSAARRALGEAEAALKRAG